MAEVIPATALWAARRKAEEDAQRARQIRYYKECVIPAFPGDPKTAPPSYRYFIDIVERLRNVKPEDLTENSVLLGSSSRCQGNKTFSGSNRPRVHYLYRNLGKLSLGLFLGYTSHIIPRA